MNSRDIVNLLMGIPFLSGGRDRNGADCFGLLLMFAQKIGIELPDVEYSENWVERGGNLLIENAHEYADEIERDELSVGDVIFFQNDPRAVNHVGIFLGEDRFIHTIDVHGSVVQRLSSQPYCRRAHSFYRLKPSR